MLRVFFFVGLAVLLPACSSTSTVSQDHSHITIKFDVGAYDEAEAEARKHCQRSGKSTYHTGTTCPSDNRCMSNFECR